MERQDLSRPYLAHHELESDFIMIIIIIVDVIIVTIIVVITIHNTRFATACVVHDQIYKERKNLAYTLQDARGVVSKLELIMGVMMHVLFVFFYLIIFDVSCTLLSHSAMEITVQASQHYIAHAMLFQLMWVTPCRLNIV